MQTGRGKTYRFAGFPVAVRQYGFLLLFALINSIAAQAQKAPLLPVAWQQKIAVHLNKNFFVAGEQVLFSIANTALMQGQPAEKLALVEIFNEKRQPVLQTNVSLQNGRGWGAWILPDTIPTGNYYFRTYTQGMRNWGPAGFFEAFLTIVNTKVPPAWASLQQPPQPSVQVFPEGGNLVNGLPNTTAILCTDQYGAAIATRGAVINQRQDTVANFNTCCGGRASFTWTPKKGDQYQVVVLSEALPKQTVVLAPALEQGFSIAVHKAVPNSVEVQVKASPDYTNAQAFLVAGKTYPLKLQAGEATVIIAERDLPEGFSGMLLYDDKGRQQAKRWWYKTPQNSLDVDIQLGQQVLEKRKAVSVDVLSKSRGNLVAADLSVSIFRVDSLQKVHSEESMPFGGDILLAKDEKGADLFVRTMGSAWNKRLPDANSNGVALVLPQYEGRLVQVQVLDKNALTPAAGVMVHLSLPGQTYQYATGISDSTGIARFSLDDKAGTGTLMASLQPTDAERYSVSLLAPFEKTHTAWLMPRFYLPEQWAPQLEAHHLSTQLELAFKLQGDAGATTSNADTTAFFGAPDKTYFLDDYTRFPTLEEVLREYIPEVLVRKKDGLFHFRVYNQPYGQFFDEDPLVLVDGLPVFNPDAFMAADPLKIRKLDIVTRRFAMGLKVFQGIISFNTYKGNLDGMPLPKGLHLLPDNNHLPGHLLQPVNPKIGVQENSRVPDQRMQLLWLPSLQTGSDGKASFSFVTSDVPGRYAVVVKGLDATGVAGSRVVYFEVR